MKAYLKMPKNLGWPEALGFSGPVPPGRDPREYANECLLQSAAGLGETIRQHVEWTIANHPETIVVNDQEAALGADAAAILALPTAEKLRLAAGLWESKTVARKLTAEVVRLALREIEGR